jgi:hypothetical protein
MKSTYTLLSIYLDNKPLLRNGFKIESSKNYISIPDIFDEYTLFDYPKCRRKVSGKFLLSTNNFSEIENCLNKLLVCHELIIMFDQNPVSLVVSQLFAKRVLQVAEMIKEQFPCISLTITANPENIEFYQKIVNEL